MAERFKRKDEKTEAAAVLATRKPEKPDVVFIEEEDTGARWTIPADRFDALYMQAGKK